MEKRSLIKFGKNSFVVSLPKSWVAANKLEKGSELYVEQKPASIIITSKHAATRERKTLIRCEGKDVQEIESELIACYKAGFAEIRLEGHALHQRAAEIKLLLQSLFGMEVVEHTLDRIIIRDLIDMRQVTVPTLVRRMDLMIRSMLQDAIDLDRSAGIIAERDGELNRLEYLLARIVRRVLENPTLGNSIDLNVLEAYHLNRVAWALERFGDYVKYLSKALEHSDASDERQLASKLQTHYIESMRIYYNRDAEAAVTQQVKLKEEVRALEERRSRKSSPLVIENLKNATRDLRVILRVIIEAAHPEA